MIKTSILTDNLSLQRLFSGQKEPPETASQTSVAMQIRCYYATLRKNMRLSQQVLHKLKQSESPRQSA